MAVITCREDGVILSSAQTGNGDSTNTAFLGDASEAAWTRPGAIVLANTGGATPTVTINVLGSVDGTNFYNIPFSRQATPVTETHASFAVTTTATETLIL